MSMNLQALGVEETDIEQIRCVCTVMRGPSVLSRDLTASLASLHKVCAPTISLAFAVQRRVVVAD